MPTPEGDDEARENVAGERGSSDKICGEPNLLVIEIERATLRLRNFITWMHLTFGAKESTD